MRVTAGGDGPVLTLRLEPGEHDRTTTRRGVGLARREVVVSLPSGSVPDLHPDLVGVAALLVAQPFTGSRLQLDRPVSERLADAVRTGLGIRLDPVGGTRHRRRPADGVPGLAYSGGVDSAVALAAMPPQTELFFLHRQAPPDPHATSAYDDRAALASCEAQRARGRAVWVTGSDVEHVRSPLGFPLDWSNGLGAVLMADERGLDAVAWGTIAESAYRIGAEGFGDLARRASFRAWRGVLRAVGLDLWLPVAGVSEVGTSAIARAHLDGLAVQSCIRGAPGQPCRRCWKCFRKGLVDAALGDRWPEPAALQRFWRRPEVVKNLSGRPIKHEDVLTWALRGYAGPDPVLRALRTRVRADALDVGWLERHYRPAVALSLSRYRDGLAARLDELLPPMGPADEGVFRAWRVEPLAPEADPTRAALRAALAAAAA